MPYWNVGLICGIPMSISVLLSRPHHCRRRDPRPTTTPHSALDFWAMSGWARGQLTMPGAAAQQRNGRKTGWLNKEKKNETAALHARRCAVPIFQLKGRKKVAQKHCNKCVWREERADGKLRHCGLAADEQTQRKLANKTTNTMETEIWATVISRNKNCLMCT